MANDLEIARAVKLQPINEIADKLDVPADALELYGRFKAKIGFDFIRSVADRSDGALVLVTGTNPTPAGEGKTTTTIGLADALNRLGRRTAMCLREPSMGPSFGQKGGATGGGRAQVAPMDEINLHFTGDFHAITAATNLLAAMIDNHVHWGNALGIDVRRISWRRAMDTNDRALRNIVVGLGGVVGGLPREEGFDITAASEMMAVFCLAQDIADLKERLARIVVAHTREGIPITARELKADGALAALLRDALQPNLVQSLEGSPALVHGGPFANIAHGCNSVMATRLALKLADVVVTEAGFGADLGAEKFIDIKCRVAGLQPAASVVVATIRALKMHGGAARAELGREDRAAVERGVANLTRHVENMRKFRLPVVVAINHFNSDTPAEFEVVRARMDALGVAVIPCTHWADGGAGAEDLARAVLGLINGGASACAPLYPTMMPLAEKIRLVAREIYRAADVAFGPGVARRLAAFEAEGYAEVPVCIAKTQYSFSADPTALGAPEGHILPVREVRLSAGAGFVVAICGDIMTMPGLPRAPAAEAVRVGTNGLIEGLF